MILLNLDFSLLDFECLNTVPLMKNGEASPCVDLVQARRIIHTALWHFNRLIPDKLVQKLKIEAIDGTLAVYDLRASSFIIRAFALESDCALSESVTGLYNAL